MAERNRNGGAWTEAEFKSRIVSGLRQISSYWKPKQQCIRSARISIGKYRCAECKEIVPSTIHGEWKSGKKKGKKRKIKNILADHIDPVIDPHKGFIDWNTYIDRMFIETGWQALCKQCHDIKTKEERAIATKRRRDDKKN